ncbi:apelin receptor [Nematostella vectensis]|uniref:apelin receptor n=1 Tax=Nematostella vectensis TaxID=45351 RepID=UPI002077598B|nr:apelin receptor [Nematostella vectensis]
MDNHTDSLEELLVSIAPIQLAEAVVIVIVNSLALAVFLSKSFRIKKSSYLLVNLTVADLMVGLTLFGLALCSLAGPTLLEKYRYIWSVANGISVDGSLFSFTVIAIERTYAIFAPFKHRQLTAKHYTLAISMSWLLSILLEIPIMLKNANILAVTTTYIFTVRSIKIVLAIIGLLMVVGCYMAIWIKLKFCNSSPNARFARSNNKLTQTLFIVTVLSFLCYLPMAAYTIYYFWFGSPQRQIYQYCIILLHVNSFANFLVYSYRIPEFRRELWRILCKCFSTKTGENQSGEIQEIPSYLRRTIQSTGQPSLIRMSTLN